MRVTLSTPEIHSIIFPQTSFSRPPSPSVPRWLLQERQDRKLCCSDYDKCLNKQLRRRRDLSEFTASAVFAWGRLAPLFLSHSKMLWRLKCVEDATHLTWPGSREWDTGARHPSKEHPQWSPPTKFCFPVMTPLYEASKVWLTEKMQVLHGPVPPEWLSPPAENKVFSTFALWTKEMTQEKQGLMCKHKYMSSNLSRPCENPCLKPQYCRSQKQEDHFSFQTNFRFSQRPYLKEVRWRVIKLDNRHPNA